MMKLSRGIPNARIYDTRNKGQSMNPLIASGILFYTQLNNYILDIISILIMKLPKGNANARIHDTPSNGL